MNNASILSKSPTIIVAAYNESKVIRKTLNLLMPGVHRNDYQIVVACNGCTDNTESIIRNEFDEVYCVSATHASKALAIRHAELLRPGFPRLYLDADIELSSEDAKALITHSRKKKSASLIVPSSKVVTKGCGAIVKSFYRAWYSTPHVQQSGFGAGTYLLNQLGRDRFGIWPELISDDGFVRSQFSSDEVTLMTHHKVIVKAPKNTLSLVKVKARSKIGNLELKKYLLQSKKTSSQPTTKTTLISEAERKWYDRAVYVLVNLGAIILAKWQYRKNKKLWLRDTSNH